MPHTTISRLFLLGVMLYEIFLHCFIYLSNSFAVPYYIFDSKLLNRLPKVQKLFVPPTNVVGPGFDASVSGCSNRPLACQPGEQL